MAARMDFGLLGPLTVRMNRVIVPITPGKQQALLAALLLEAGRTVTVDHLAELLWSPGSPPPSAPVTVQNYVRNVPGMPWALAGTGSRPGQADISSTWPQASWTSP